MIEIEQWVVSNQLRQEDAARILKVSLPRLSDVMTGKIRKFIIDALVDMLENAGLHVTVQIA
jgi:predicted XRE-type DNA-binding protein